MPEKISRVIIIHLQEFNLFWMITVSGFNRRRRIQIQKKKFMRYRIIIAAAIGIRYLIKKKI